MSEWVIDRKRKRSKPCGFVVCLFFVLTWSDAIVVFTTWTSNRVHTLSFIQPIAVITFVFIFHVARSNLDQKSSSRCCWGGVGVRGSEKIALFWRVCQNQLKWTEQKCAFTLPSHFSVKYISVWALENTSAFCCCCYRIRYIICLVH